MIVRATAEEFANQLCGAVSTSMCGVARAGAKLSMTDILVLSAKIGVPRVYLLSNSLNKAAGDWPFAVVEFDRVNSWKIFAYVRGLVSGSDRGRSLVVDEVWSGTAKPKDAETDHPRTPVEPLETTSPLSIFKQGIRRTYFEIHELVEQRGINAGSPEVNATIDKLIADWPATDDSPEVFAKLIVEGVLGREQHAATIADQLMKHSKFQLVALAIDSLLVECLLDRLIPDASWRLPPIMERVDLLLRAGRAIGMRDRGTDFVRNRINPALQRYASDIEAGHSTSNHQRWDPFFAGLCLVIIGLDVARSAKHAPIQHRLGLATDYIHFLGRLLRSWVSEELYGHPEDLAFGENFGREALHLAKALRAELGSDLDAALDRLMEDSMLPDAFKKLLHGESTQTIP